ncbi:MAG TPA: hypothetical protein VFK05_07900, partial [Polyangiaceae bacterium]|nr:hypothetical protein [Polyangiaceae bacterium]
SGGVDGGNAGNGGNAEPSGGQAGSGGVGGGNAGNGGNAEPSGGQAGSGGVDGGNAGNGGMPGSAVVSPLSLSFNGQCHVPDQSFAISNTGSIPLTWFAQVLGSAPVYVHVASSTLLPAASVTVAVSQFLQPFYGTFSGTIAISTDVAGQLGPIAVSYSVSGSNVSPPSDIDFGAVPLGSQKRISIAAAPTGADLLVSSNPDFLLSGLIPGDPPGFWTLTFVPRLVGPQSTTLTLGSFPPQPACSPNTFTASGVGVTP